MGASQSQTPVPRRYKEHQLGHHRMLTSPRSQEHRLVRLSPIASGQPLHEPIVPPDNRYNLFDPDWEVSRRPFTY